MLAVTTKVGDRPVTLDLHSLPVRLADGTETFAHKLNREQLYEAVKGLIDVAPGIGWQDCALALAKYQHLKREAA